MEHGKVAHTQVYPECLEVPLLIVHPEQVRGQKIQQLVELVDVAPTLYEMAGLEAPESLSGSSLVSLIQTGSSRPADGEAYAEVLDAEFVYTLLTQKRDRLYQLLMAEPEFDPTGPWIRGSVGLDTDESTLSFEAHSFFEPRKIRVLSDGELLEEITIGPDWTPVEIDLPEGDGPQRVVLEADGCATPAEVGEGEDNRCLSFQVRNFRPLRFELYDLISDPGAQVDLYRQSDQVRSALQRRLLELDWDALDSGGNRSLSSEDEETLRALGYLD